MAGMDANLTLAQAKAQQERICAHTEHQGPKSSGGSGHSETISQEKKKEKY